MGAYELIEDASLYKTFTTGLRPWENHTTTLAGEEMHPFWWLAPPPFPPAGGLYSSLCVERLKSALR